MPIPPGLHGWYKTAYPTLVFNPDWLEACVEYLQVSFISLSLSLPPYPKADRMNVLLLGE